MVHENADRAHVPGQPQVPERDIEPLWPPEQTDPATTPPWATPAQPGAPTWPIPATSATPPSIPWPPPAAPAAESPPQQPATADPGPAEVRPDVHVPAPRAARPAVDLDLPFTLDQPPAPTAGRDTPPPTQPATPDGPPSGGAMTGGAMTGGPTAGGPTPDGATPDVPTAGVAAKDGASAEAAGGSHQAGGATANGRSESPWSQPPQRAAAPEPSSGPATSTDPGPPEPPTAPPPPPGPEAPAPVHAGTGPGPAEAFGDEATPTPAGPETEAPEATPAPPRLGPFPPAPGVPLQQPAYGNGYPPAPAGYGQPGYPGDSAYPPPQAAGPAPGWYPPNWPQAGNPQQSGSPEPPRQPAAPPPEQPTPGAYPDPAWTAETGATPTAEDFARRRQAKPADPVATMGVRAVVNKIGLVRLPPGRHEQELKRDIEMVRRNFGGLRQVTVVNPKGGAGKTVAILLLAMTFGQKRGGYVLAWDNNETQGTLGMRAQQDFHSRTVRDMLRDLAQFQGPHGRVGDLSQYVRSQGEGMFDVLASDESATGGEMLTAAAFAEIREVVSRFYKLIFVDTGNNVRAQNWQAAMDATDQLVVTMSARNDSAETAARMLDHLEQSGRQRLVRQAVTVVSMPPSRKEIDLPAIQAHFAARTRAVLLAPYERLIDTGEPIRYGQLSSATRDAWLKIAAAVAEGL
ncbi:chromosome partitioning protein [Micromonospora sp. NPDC048930]|uniref:MinD/ParA family ATP-binding protein n=1 Tax=Micromonospora sp. NPDC048930 TaxID=3364261 RepID=UPI003712C35E